MAALRETPMAARDVTRSLLALVVTAVVLVAVRGLVANAETPQRDLYGNGRQLSSTGSEAAAELKLQEGLLHRLARLAAAARRPRPRAPATEQLACRCEFQRYIPSALEKRWTANVRSWQARDPCVSQDNANRWLEQVRTAGGAEMNASSSSAVSAAGSHVRQPGAVGYDRHILSTMAYTKHCPGQEAATVYVPIEPIAGISRDPRKCFTPMSEQYTQSKEYLLPLSLKMGACPAMHVAGEASARDAQATGARQAFLFDAGATLEGEDSGLAKKWSGTGWIVKWYAERGIDFDHVYGWEPRRKVKATALEREMAESWRPGQRPRAATGAMLKALRVFDHGVSSDAGSFWNPLTLIRSLTRPEDFVVFKLDIDTLDTELRIVQQLLADKELIGLVDEFYFEYHLHNRVMRMHKQGEEGMTEENDLASWYAMVGPARHAGLRMHLWP